MAKKSVTEQEFIRIATEQNFEEQRIIDYIKAEINSEYSVWPHQVRARLAHLARKGLIPLDSGNKVGVGEVLKGTSTLYDLDGDIVQQWVKTDVDKGAQLQALEQVVKSLAIEIKPLKPIPTPQKADYKQYATMYLSADVHFGSLMWDKESGEDWNIEKADELLRNAYDYLFATSPNSKIGIVADLGDLLEVDNFDSKTPKSGNVLPTDSRFPKILKAAYHALIYAIQRALEKHEVVHFINISGNHDITTGHAIREIIIQTFANNPRVIVNESPTPIKYFQHGKTLLGFAHGDGLKMKDAGEVMAHDCHKVFSDTMYRFFHFGHYHKDAVIDGKLCRAESHRNLAPLNAWAHHKGYRSGKGTMKSITYDKKQGEVSRNTFNL